MLAEQSLKYLKDTIIPFWNNLIDTENGGFYGYVGNDLKVDKKAEKGGILNSRILWFYSTAYIQLKDESLLIYADHAFDFLKNSLWDNEFGGIYWSVSYDGKIPNTLKHTYNFAFALYALSAYYRATQNAQAKEMADNIFTLIETTCKAEKGYYESFSRDFDLSDNEELSENGVLADRTMNTLLHIVEAYSEYYVATDEEKARITIIEILEFFKDNIYDTKAHKLNVFFDEDYNSLIDLNSYGHDIEASWLLDRACQIVEDKKIIEEIGYYNTKIAERILKVAFEKGAVNNECENGVVDKTRIWWVQCESVIGFLNAFEKTNKIAFWRAGVEVWEYIKDNMIDKRENSEFFNSVDYEGNPITSFPMVDLWKCPYHNGRMCLEILKRFADVYKNADEAC